ncbi:BTAD domain-containing putative transcriptional regulator [Actinosynnema sp. NPDC047251]|nr:AfsR/SARP family transcriptional regulator [Saccharothrix espanaensis]
MAVRFAVLGDVRVESGTSPVVIRQRQQQSVLAALLVDVNKLVSLEALTDRVWGAHLPRRPREALYSHVSRLRALLSACPGTSIDGRSGGYVLTADQDGVDLHEFRRLVAEAGRAQDDHRAMALLTDALARWTGEAFADLDTPWFTATREVLARERLDAQLELNDIRLRHGGHAASIAGLGELAAAHPLDERIAGQLVLALYQSGRQQDALRCYDRIRRGLAEELGVDPGPALRELHRGILTASTSLATPARPERPRSPVPRQLPAAPRAFTAREGELAVMTAVADRAATVVVSALSGIGGIGKTWLSLHWAYRHLDRFPDGQLFVNLRGFDPADRPLPAPVALRGFLDALGVVPEAIPHDLDTQAALYRSLVADKRMLIVLDNAVDTAQVVPLLPGGDTCTVVVTSRNRLAGLVTAHGAHPLRLDALPAADARDLLVARLGADRVAAEPAAVDDLVARCAGLPLALGIVAGCAQQDPDLPLAGIAADLRDAARLLGGLDEDDAAASVRAVLSWSTTALTEAEARTFTLLGTAPEVDISLAAVARLTDRGTEETAAALRALERVSLVHQGRAGRYHLHDLVRLYAAEQPLPEGERRAALVRLVDHYTDTAHTTSDAAFPSRQACLFGTASPEPPPDHAGAWEWYQAERTNLVVIERAATAQGLVDRVWHLAWHLVAFRTNQGALQENLAAWQNALTCAERLGRADVTFHSLLLLGHAHAILGGYREGLHHVRRAAEVVDRTGNPVDRVRLEIGLSTVLARSGDLRTALVHARRAHALFEGVDDPGLESNVLGMVGSLAGLLGDHEEGRAALERSLELDRRFGDRYGQAGSLRWLAEVERKAGRLERARDRYRAAAETSRAANYAYNEATVLVLLGEVHLELGERAEARAVWELALDLLRGQHRTSDVDRLCRRLHDLGWAARQAGVGSAATPGPSRAAGAVGRP